jgi:dipeptidyl aminopeptidase/acylaminoacyl peptidase
MNRTGRVCLVLTLLALPLAAAAQKKPLTQADWDRWRTIAGAELSPDGRWVAYTQNPRVGDGDFVVRSTSGASEYHVNLGFTNRENNTPGFERGRAGGGPPGGGGGGRGGRGGGGGAPRGLGPFSADSKYAFVMVTQLPQVEAERAERANPNRGRGRGGAGNAAEASSNVTSLRIIRLADGNIDTVAGARSFRVPEANGKWLVYSPGANADAPADSTAAAGAGRAGRGGGAPPAGARGPRRNYGSTIVLRNLDTGAEERLADVAAYTFDDSAKVLAYTVTSRDSVRDGVYIRDLVAGNTKTVLSGPGNYRGFSFDRTQKQFVFASDRDDFGKPDARTVVYHGTLRTGTAAPVVSSAALPPNMRFPDNFAASFTRAGNAVTLAIAPPADDGVPADSLVGKPRFDLWHWKDVQVQPTQLMQLNQARNRTYQALVNLTSKKLTQITTDEFPNASLSDDASVALSSTGVPYALESTWGAGGNDVYLLDPATGTRKPIAKKITGQAQLSVGGKYIVYFDRMHWYAHNVATGKTVDITGPIAGVHFEQETFSRPDDPSAWGLAGWTRDDRSVLVYDRFDIWEIDPNGVRPAVTLTDSAGRRENLTLRVVNLDSDEEERYVDTTRPLFLSAFDEDTKEAGFYRARLDARRAPEKIVMAPVRFGAPSKARSADVFMATKSTFADFPNLYVGPNLASLNTKLSDANPWQKDYAWGTAELVEWLSDDGIPRQGILYKPDNFDPAKKYPMITYFYEDLSDGLYSYIAPNGGTSVNITHYVSNGYLMFEPDIHYEMGHPGASAMKSILPGVQSLIARGFVDPKRLGLQGHSWGGYQIAYMITQTSLFAAAEAGAPVSNMTSAYGGIRWESGINRAGQYETGQSRIGKSIWEGLPLYIENSPLFGLDRVKTPLLILHNDQDGAVPWYQGIELYIGMRRLGKEAYLFNYNNELHGISGRANQKDWAMRMQQFFDTKLKGAPAPEWMVKGIPAKDKGKDVIKKVTTTDR